MNNNVVSINKNKKHKIKFMYGSIDLWGGSKTWSPSYNSTLGLIKQFEHNKKNGFLEEWKTPFDRIDTSELMLGLYSSEDMKLSFIDRVKRYLWR